MKVNDNVIYRCVAGEHMLIPVCDAAQQKNGFFVLNEVSAEIWKLLSDGKTFDEIVISLTKTFDAPSEQIRADTEAFIRKLVDARLLTL